MATNARKPPNPKPKKAAPKKSGSKKAKGPGNTRSKSPVELESSESEDPPSPISILHPPEHFTPVKSGPNQQIRTPSKPQAKRFNSPKPSLAIDFDWDEVAQDQTLGRGKGSKKAPKQFLGDFFY